MATGGALIGALRVTLGLDSAQFENGTKKARQTAQRDVTAIQKSLDGLKGRLDTVYAAVAGSAILAAGKKALDYASSLGEIAQQAGVTTKELQQYRYAASQAGISNEEMDKSLAKLTRTIGEAKAGSKAQATVFRELGVAVQDANGRVYSAGEVIPKLADALAKIKDPATRARVEVDLFGKAGQKLDTMLAGGSKAVNELRGAAQKLGVVLSDEQIQNADNTADKLSALKQVLEANIAGAVANNANAILGLANAVASLSSRAMKFVQEYPKLAGALAGAAAGARFGPTGAAIGAGIGAVAGSAASDYADDANMDIGFRMKRLKEAQAELKARQRSGSSGGGLITIRRAGERTKGGTLETQTAEVRRQTALLMQATAGTLAQRQGSILTPIPDGALPTVASSGGGSKKGRSGPTAAEIAAKHEEELSRIRQEQIQAELALTTDAEKRAELQSQLLLEEFNERAAQIANDEHFTVDQKAAQKAALKALYGVSGEGDNMVVGGGPNTLSAGVSRELMERLAREEYDLTTTKLEADRSILQGQLGLARTADDRRRLELELLDIDYRLREAKLDQVINSQESSRAEKDLAQMAKDRLGEQRAVDGASVERQNMGPLASYLDSLPQTAGEVNEAFEGIAANGLANMNDQLAQAAANTLKLKGFAGQLFNQLIADVIRLNIQQAAGGSGGLFGVILKGATSVFGGGSALGGVNASALSALDAQAAAISTRNLVGLATGGTIGGFPGVDKNILSINGVPTARVSANERIRVEPNSANDNGGAPMYFDLRGAVMTQDLLAQMNAMADGAALRGATGGSAMAQSGVARRARRRIPGR